MPDLEVEIMDGVGERLMVGIWNDTCTAYTQKSRADDWFTRFTGEQLRLVRFDPSHRRVSDAKWTGDVTALNRFSDGYPILIISEASLRDLNGRLPISVPMNRFRPNVVVSGISAYGEDRLDALSAGDIVFKIVKPCARCRIVNTKQSTGTVADQPLRTLATYRRNERVKGAVTFGQNVIVAAGSSGALRVGQELTETWRA